MYKEDGANDLYLVLSYIFYHLFFYLTFLG